VAARRQRPGREEGEGGGGGERRRGGLKKDAGRGGDWDARKEGKGDWRGRGT